MTTLTHTFRSAALVGLFAPALALPAAAQLRAPRPPLPPEPPVGRTWAVGGFSGNRAYLGLTLRNSSGPADTLGLLVDDVEDGLPAARAGIGRGARLVSIDDVDLRVDPRDLGDFAGEALPGNRLRRTLARREPGDTVVIVALIDGRRETKRVVLAESPMATSLRTLSGGRRVLGLSFSERGSRRDTAGLLVVSVTSGGAADRAGISEGDRLVSIDGVDLRVPEPDAGSSDGVEARVARLRRALDAARDSQPVRLEVVSDGRRRTLSVTPTRERGFSISLGGMRGLDNLSADIQRGVRTSIDIDDDDDDDDDRDARDDARARAEGMRAQAEVQREMTRAQAEVQREMARVQRELAREQRDRASRSADRFERWSRDDDDDRDDARPTRGMMRGRTDGATLTLGGLTLATVDRDFAQQFGRGAEDGALVVRVRGEWDPIRAGDVLLSVDGRTVRDGSSLDVTFDRRRELRIEILRNGRKETITLPATR